MKKIFDMHANCGKWGSKADCNSLVTEIADSENIEKLLVSNLGGLETEGLEPGNTPLLEELDANRQTMAFCQLNPKMLAAAICQVGHSTPDSIETALTEYNFRALRFHPYFQDISPTSEKYDPYMEIAKQYEIPCIFHAAPGKSDPANIYSLAKRHPKVKVVLYHLNLTGDCEYGIEVVQNSIRKRDARLYCNTSWVPLDMVVKAIQTLGSERVMFGSDMPIDGENHFRYYRGIIQTIDSIFSEEDCNNYLYETANKLFDH